MKFGLEICNSISDNAVFQNSCNSMKDGFVINLILNLVFIESKPLYLIICGFSVDNFKLLHYSLNFLISLESYAMILS